MFIAYYLLTYLPIILIFTDDTQSLQKMLYLSIHLSFFSWDRGSLNKKKIKEIFKEDVNTTFFVFKFTFIIFSHVFSTYDKVILAA